MNIKNANLMILDFMKTEPIKSLDKDVQKEIYNAIGEIVAKARLEVVEDAEKAIGNLRVFSLQ